jgi:hypothetical protein
MAATAKGFSKLVAAGVAAGPFDPIDMMGNAGLERCQGFWVMNTDGTNIAYLHQSGTATVNGDDTIPLMPRIPTWVAKPGVNKGTNPTAVTPWSFIGATATCNVIVASDDGSWHPYR